jgi:hypothetical protein
MKIFEQKKDIFEQMDKNNVWNQFYDENSKAEKNNLPPFLLCISLFLSYTPFVSHTPSLDEC